VLHKYQIYTAAVLALAIGEATPGRGGLYRLKT
jgi:hypothetical protein